MSRLTTSPPDAKEIFGISCTAMTDPLSRLVSLRQVLVIVRQTSDPACSSRGFNPRIFTSRRSICEQAKGI